MGSSRAVFPPDDRRRMGMRPDFVGRVAEAAQSYDYDVLLTTVREVGDPPFQRLPAGDRVDGVILMVIKPEDSRSVRHEGAKADGPLVELTSWRGDWAWTC